MASNMTPSHSTDEAAIQPSYASSNTAPVQRHESPDEKDDVGSKGGDAPIAHTVSNGGKVALDPDDPESKYLKGRKWFPSCPVQVAGGPCQTVGPRGSARVGRGRSSIVLHAGKLALVFVGMLLRYVQILESRELSLTTPHHSVFLIALDQTILAPALPVIASKFSALDVCTAASALDSTMS